MLTGYVVSLPDVSVAFEDLIARLLDKNPATRIGWDELPEHPFWESPLPQAAMLEQPLLETFIAENNLAPQQGVTHSREVTFCRHVAQWSQSSTCGLILNIVPLNKWTLCDIIR